MLCRSDRLGHAVVAAALVAAATLRPAAAAETVHVGKAVATAFTFTPLDSDIRQEIFKGTERGAAAISLEP